MTIDFATARQRMVDNQIRTTDVTSHALLDSFFSVAREAFVPDDMKPLAYIDNDIEVLAASSGSPARYVVEPSPLAKLLQLADFQSDQHVLEIGAGSGYVSALISKLAKDVVAVESDPDLAERAKSTLSEQGFENVDVICSDLEQGQSAKGPYDTIFLSGAVETVPETLLSQLKDGGRLIAVVGYGGSAEATVFQKENDKISSRKAFNSSIPALPGFARVVEFEF